MLDESSQTFVVYGIKEASNIRIEHPAHFLPVDANAHCIESVVLATSRPEPVRETCEQGLIDGIEDRDSRTLAQD